MTTWGHQAEVLSKPKKKKMEILSNQQMKVIDAVFLIIMPLKLKSLKPL
jgi:hypothetical protein